jgi:hypothetical protein
LRRARSGTGRYSNRWRKPHVGKDIEELVEWALPIQRRDFETARSVTATLARAEQPNEDT